MGRSGGVVPAGGGGDMQSREQLEPQPREQRAVAGGGRARSAPSMEVEKEFRRLDQAASWLAIYQVRRRAQLSGIPSPAGPSPPRWPQGEAEAWCLPEAAGCIRGCGHASLRRLPRADPAAGWASLLARERWGLLLGAGGRGGCWPSSSSASVLSLLK